MWRKSKGMRSKRSSPGVPFFDLKRQYALLRRDLNVSIQQVCASGHYILGPQGSAFEREAAAYCGVKHAVAVASGSDALWLSLNAMGVGPGDEVITTPYTFIATVTAILKTGARPVFVDIEEHGFNMDPERIEPAMTPRTRAVIPVHLFGLCAGMRRINAIARKHGLAVLEDAAQSFGSRIDKKTAGAIGMAGATSFYPTKNLGGFGDGGMVFTSDAALAGKIRLLRAHGASRKYHHEVQGWVSRLDEIQAAVLRVKLSRINRMIDARRKIAKTYVEAFQDLPVDLPVEPKGYIHTYNQFVIRVRRRDELAAYLSSCGVGTEIYYPAPLHFQPCFSALGYRRGDFPNAQKAALESMALPVFPELTTREVRIVIRAVKAFFRSKP